MGTVRFGGLWASDPEGTTHDPGDLTEGFWVVVLTFEGELTAVRMGRHGHGGQLPARPWRPLEGAWRSSLTRTAYLDGVAEVRRRVAAGTVYQVNLCRILEHDLEEDASIAGLAARLSTGNPAPYAATIDLPEAGLEIACASPEGFLEREGSRVVTRPIKGTAPTVEEMLPKDVSENVMIVDLVRHDLAGICRPGSVAVERLCRDEVHPGLVHLVSDVAGTLREGVEWPEVFAAMAPPGSVSGAPKHTAMAAIGDLEPVPRGPYCGGIGWIDADRQLARLAVGIRTFWAARRDDGQRVLRFGTGAGITWGSDAEAEWEETELKARRLIGLASGRLAP